MLARVQEVAVGAHVALGCRDLCRVDFIVGDEGDPDRVTLLEVNTLPGMTATSLYPEAAGVKGLTMPALCSALATVAHKRGPTPRLAPRPLPQYAGKPPNFLAFRPVKRIVRSGHPHVHGHNRMEGEVDRVA